MRLTSDVKKYLDRSVLCWLATISPDGSPNVSPKEIFVYDEDDRILIAQIASPQTERNIRINARVCLSFIDILVQKGFQVHGDATILDPDAPSYAARKKRLEQMTEGKFPFKTIIEIKVTRTKPIIAPRYLFFPGTTEEEQMARARIQYGISD
ncbi:MAG: pyridoxamine 5'-phosphate oxidase family protein [Saprospiraceae bacterium]|nr:pyridoxamine 5'-phosphate oxidase family protein [Saprospiraceae bacterium]